MIKKGGIDIDINAIQAKIDNSLKPEEKVPFNMKLNEYFSKMEGVFMMAERNPSLWDLHEESHF